MNAHEILQRRAAALARAPSVPEAAGASEEVMVWRLGGQQVAMASRFVRGVQPLGEHTPVPGAPAIVYAVLVHRGAIVPIYDLRRALALPTRGLSDRRELLLVGTEEAELALLCDAVLELRELRTDAIQPNPGGAGELGAVRGVTADGVLVLDGERVLAHVPGIEESR